jgi:hypothetical protein
MYIVGHAYIARHINIRMQGCSLVRRAVTPHPGVFCMNVKVKSLREKAICKSMKTKDDETRNVSPRGALSTIYCAYLAKSG